MDIPVGREGEALQEVGVLPVSVGERFVIVVFCVKVKGDPE